MDWLCLRLAHAQWGKLKECLQCSIIKEGKGIYLDEINTSDMFKNSSFMGSVENWKDITLERRKLKGTKSVGKV